MSVRLIAAPSFLPRDPDAITAELVADWEERAQKPLYPAQVERLLIDQLAYRETLTRLDIQVSAEQNLLDYAVRDALDALGVLLNCTRLPAEPARCTLCFTLSVAQPLDRVWPRGEIIRSGNGLGFALAGDARIPAGGLSVEVDAVAIEPGTAANALAVNTIRYPDAPDSLFSVTNLTAPEGGREIEQDEPFRERLRLASARASAGSLPAYRYQARSVSSRIVDVWVSSPTPGRIRIALLTDTGAPNPVLLAHATTVLTDPTTRPFTDEVQVVPARRHALALNIGLIVQRGATQVVEAVHARLDAFAAARRCRLAQGLRPEQIAAEVMAIPGVIGLVSPSADWLVDLADDAYLDLAPITVTLSEVRDV